ncbi:helix-turn-helix domain-containing protein [Psychroserpens luteus]|uniref:Helix-turn-helix domain-containing protein n=1 Tax=Psychroserpens luteus TaxID=1434066 RepID=A0ABW5ZS51_9FLAO|nr:helix-turn-helix domain-containing protein [Psychroserpens luteus]
MKNIKFEDMPKAVELILENITAIADILNQQELHSRFQDPESLMTRKETAEYLKIDLSTLWSWTKKGKIKCYGISNRRYYKRSDIEKALVLLNK